MTEPLATYHIERSGFFTPRFALSGPDGPLGVLQLERKRLVVSGATFRPEKGEVIHIRRDPGLLRAQFSMWTEAREWLGSSLRWSFFARPVTLHTGTKPQQLVPLPSFGPGWRLMAPKTGENARLTSDLFGRRAKLDVFRRLDLEVILLATFLGALMHWELLWPAPTEHTAEETAHPPPHAPGGQASQA